VYVHICSFVCYEEFFDEILRNCLEHCLLPFFKLSVKPIDLVGTRSNLVGDSRIRVGFWRIWKCKGFFLKFFF
jgi:hypothetical protein